MMIQITREQKKLIKNIIGKVDREANYNDLVSLFGFKVEFIYDKSAAGSYDFKNKIISINQEYKEDKENLYDTFFHEFGHLIHEATDKTDFYNHYRRRNNRFSELLFAERQASLIGYEFWKWKFPDKKIPSPLSYFDEKSINFLKDYYKIFFEMD